MDKEKLAQLMTDYLAGKITAEEFSAQRNSMEGKSDTSQNPAPGVLCTMEAVFTILYELVQLAMCVLILYMAFYVVFLDK